MSNNRWIALNVYILMDTLPAKINVYLTLGKPYFYRNKSVTTTSLRLAGWVISHRPLIDSPNTSLIHIKCQTLG